MAKALAACPGAGNYLVDQYINGAWVQIANLGSGSTSYAIAGLKPSTTYYFDVAAANSSGSTWASSSFEDDRFTDGIRISL